MPLPPRPCLPPVRVFPPSVSPILSILPVPEGHHVIVVTSGAVGVGCQRLGLTTKPSVLAKKQALAAVGQVHLMKYYEDFLGALGLVSGPR